MTLDSLTHSDDPAHLREVIGLLVERVNRLEREQSRLQAENRALFLKLYRRRSEKLDPNQLGLVFEAMLDLGVAAAELEEIEVEVVKRKRKGKRKPTGRHPLPAHLPRERIEHPLPEEERHCKGCGSELVKIREETSEQLEFVPSSFRVLEHVRGVFACKGCEESITRSPKPPQAIEKGLPGPGLLAHVMLSKYGDHQPLHRQHRIFEREGVDISCSTLCGWVAEAAALTRPVWESMREDLLCSRIVQTDDTPVTVLEPGQKGSHKGRLWVYLGDREHPVVLFDYTPTRERDGPSELLSSYRGYLQADAYSGYDCLFSSGSVVEVACWAHARRYFHKTVEAARDSRGFAALGFIRQLFKIEREGRELDAAARRALRQEKAKPVLEKFESWLLEHAEKALPKSTLGQGIGYCLNQWAALGRYLEDGELSIDNSASERALRAVAVGRKNWMFAGSDAGGERAAGLYTLIQTAKRNGVEPFAYLRDLFARLPTHPADRAGELAPHRWSLQTTPPS